jgi:hypothetical protein
VTSDLLSESEVTDTLETAARQCGLQGRTSPAEGRKAAMVESRRPVLADNPNQRANRQAFLVLVPMMN